MLHFRTDISHITSTIIIAAHSMCRNLGLSAFFTLIIQIFLFTYHYNIYRIVKKKIFNIEKECLQRSEFSLNL